MLNPSAETRRLRGWWVVVLLLVAALPPLLIRVGERETTAGMERLPLVTAQETWLRQHAGEADAWLIPTNNGRPRLIKPPLTTWLYLLAWSDLDPQTADPQTLVFRARLVSVAMCLLTMLGIYWLGVTLGDRSLGLLAVLIAGSMFFLQRQGRAASYDIFLLAFGTISIGAGLVRITQHRLSGRPVRGWWLLVVCGFFLGLAWMSKGPIALVMVVMPLMAAIGLVSRHRARDGLFLLGAMALAAAIVAPWFIYAWQHVPDAANVWIKEYRSQQADPTLPVYYLAIIALVAPWTVWFVAGLFHPFIRSSGTERRIQLVPLVWLLAILIVLSFADAKQQRYMLPVIPAAALLIARVWRDHERLARQGRVDEGAHRLIGPHWSLLLGASIIFGVVLIASDRLFSESAASWVSAHVPAFGDWPSEPPVRGIASLVGALAALALVLTAALGWRWHRAGRPLAAAVTTAIWSLLAATVGWYGYAQAENKIEPVRADAEILAPVLRDHEVVFLDLPGERRVFEEPGLAFRFYLMRVIPPIRPRDLARRTRAGEEPPDFILARDDDAHRVILEDAGATPLRAVQATWQEAFRLWGAPRPAMDRAE